MQQFNDLIDKTLKHGHCLLALVYLITKVFYDILSNIVKIQWKFPFIFIIFWREIGLVLTVGNSKRAN